MKNSLFILFSPFFSHDRVMIWVACQSVHLVEWAWRNAQFSKEYIIWNEQRAIENQQVYFNLI